LQFPTWFMAGQAASRDFAGLLHVFFSHPPLVRFPIANRLGFVVRSIMRSKSGRGWRLFFGANRRQAAGFRQCWIALEMLGLPLVF
jgi:hypothetical protein